MHITHLDIVTVLGGIFALIIFMLGYWRGHYRAYAECCDCCTCQTCTEGERDEDADYDYPLSPVAATSEARRETLQMDAWRPDPDFGGRRVVVLEPGPTTYPALVALAQDAMDEPERHADDMDSTFVSRVLLSWESRYPIPQEVAR